MKKVLIEIPDGYIAKLNDIAVTSIYAEHIIKCGKVISEMTNGDVIKAMFPNAKTWEVTRDDVHCAYIEFEDICEIKSFPLSWWNAPYMKEVEE